MIKSHSKTTTVLVVFSITLLGAILRFSGIEIRELWYDEIFSVFVIQHSWKDMWVPIASDLHPPLYYMLLKIYTSLVGINEFTLRSFSALFGITTILLTYYYARLYFVKTIDSWKAYIPTLLVAINPLFIIYSQEARSYTLLAFLMLLMVFFFQRALLSSPFTYSKNWLFFSLSATAAFFTHYISVFAIGTCILIILLYWHTHKPSSISYRSLLRIHRTPIILPLILFILWLPIFIQQLKQSFTLNWIPALHVQDIPYMIYAFFFGVESPGYVVPVVNEIISPRATFILVIGMSVGILYTLFSFVTERKSYFSFIWITFAAGALPIIGLLFLSIINIKLYLLRYLLGYVLFVVIAFGIYIAQQKKPWISLSILLLYCIVLFWCLPPTVHTTYFKTISHTVLPSSSQPVLIARSPLEYVVLRYYADSEHNQQIKIQDENNNYFNWILIDPQTIIAYPQQWPKANVLNIESIE